MPRIEFEKIKDEARGRWRGIFAHLGIEVGDGRHTICPICQKASKFRCDDKTGAGEWICTCGAGDGLKLIMEALNVDFVTAVEMIIPIVGIVEPTEREEKKTFSAEQARKIFVGAVRASHQNAAGQYLRNRGLRACPETLWYHEKMWNVHSKTHLPAMVACVTNKSGQVTNLHQTFLTPDGQKAGIEKPKILTMNFDKTDPTGRAIRLFPPEHECVGIAEGIETALACYEMHGIPTWAAVSASWMIGWEPPEGIPLRKVYIFGDRDNSFTGQAAAYQLAHKLKVRRKIDVEVQLPPEGDWLDEHVKRTEK